MTRFVVDCDSLIHTASGEVDLAPGHRLLAPTLVRSQALAWLYEASRRGEISASEALERIWHLNAMKVRFLCDRVLQQTAWKIAEQLGWQDTYDAEFVALTRLQADALVTSNGDLARAVSGIVRTATPDALGAA
jgi:predicted nucleic acid-binding protein